MKTEGKTQREIEALSSNREQTVSLPHSEPASDALPGADRTFWFWRRIHRGSSIAIALFAILHVGLTPMLYGQWSPDAVWFAGTGLGLLLIAGMNLAHVGLGPCEMPTASAVRFANWVFAAFGFGAVVAVPEPQAVVIAVALLGQAIASRWTLRARA